MLVAVLCAFFTGTAWGEDQTWTHEFKTSEEVQNNAITVDGVTWNIATTAGAGEPTITGATYSKVYGIKFGSSKSVYFGSVTFSTDYFNDYNVKSVKVNILNNGTKQGTLTAQQGSTNLGSSSATFGTTWTDLTVNTTPGTGGQLSFTYSVEQAFYIHSITVVYEENTSGKTTATLTIEDLPEGDIIIGHSFDIKVSTNSTAEIQSQNLSTVFYVESFDKTTGIAKISHNQEGTGRIRFFVEENDNFTAAERILTFTNRKDYTSIVFDDSQITNTDISKGVEAGKLIAKMKRESDGQIWTSSQTAYNSFTFASLDENVATIAADGTITLVGAGTVSLTAKYNGAQYFAESPVATYELTVTDSDAPEPITLWSEDFSDYDADDVPNGGTYGYVCQGTTKIYENTYAGGVSPELFLNSGSGSFTAVVPLNNAYGTLTLTYKTNNNPITVSTTTEGVEGGGTTNSAGEHTITFTGVTTSLKSITIVFSAGNKNVRLDDIQLVGVAQVNAVEAPTFTPNPGNYYGAQNVTLSCATEGATILYRLSEDGEWLNYSSAIAVEHTTTIYAKAVKGDDESSVSSGTYSIVEKNDVEFNITDKELVYGTPYTVTVRSFGTPDVKTNGDGETTGHVTLTSASTAIARVENLTIIPVAVGQTTITIDVTEGDDYKPGSTTINVTVVAPEGLSTKKPNLAANIFEEHFNAADGTGPVEGSDWKGNIAASAWTADNEGWTYPYNSSNNAQAYAGAGCARLGSGSVSGWGTTPAIAFDGTKTYTLTFKAGAWHGDNTALTLSCEGDNAAVIGSTSFTLEEDAWTEYTTTVKAAAGSKLKFSVAGRFFLDDVVITDPNAAAPTIAYTIPASGMGTFCSEYPLDLTTANMPTGVKAYKVSEMNGSKVVLNQITEPVMGGTGIIVKGPAGTVQFKSVDCSAQPSGNLLVGTLAPTYLAQETVYGLSGGKFYLNNAGTINANRAYLPVPEQTGELVKSLVIQFNDATGITRTQTITDEEAIFDLTGRRLQKVQKGVNIVNGKKVLVK